MAMTSSSSSTSTDGDMYHLDGDDERDTTPTTPHLLDTTDEEQENENENENLVIVGGISEISLDSPTDDDDVRGSSSRPIPITRRCDSESGGRRKQKRRGGCKERLLNSAWELRRCSSGDLECSLMVRPCGGEGRIRMDREEVKACRDLGIALPRDCTVEISGGGDSNSPGSGGSSPISDWRISSPGDSPKDVKARLKIWAQAVALSSTSRLGISRD